jgi:hypothetical protein
MKKLTVGIALVLLLLAATAISGFAKPQNYDSGFQVQNLSSDTDANITMTFYNRNGTVDLTVNDSIDMGGSNTYFPLTDDPGNPNGFPTGSGDVSDNFDGSVVISSNTEIAAIANLGADSLLFGASYNGFSAGSPDVALPLLMYDNYGFDTWISVQNTGTSTTDITVDYSDGDSTTVTGVAPGAAAKFDQMTESHASGWVGSATASTSDGGSGSIAATVIQEGPATLYAYGGFPSGSTNPVMPIYQANNYGYHTGIQVQNLGGSASDVTVTFTSGLAGTTCTETRSINAGKSLSFGLYVHHPSFVDPNPGSLVSETCTQGEWFVGSATVTGNSNGVDLAAVVNQTNFGASKGSLYNGFDPGSATTTVLAPLVMDRNYGFGTGLTLVNAGGGTIAAGDIACTFVSSSGAHADVNASNPDPLDPGEAWSMIHGNAGSPLDVPLGNGFVGSGTCTGPGGSQLFGIVNELGDGTYPGDTLFTYEGTNQ